MLMQIDSATQNLDPYRELERIGRSFRRGDLVVNINTNLKLTKTEINRCEANLLNDQSLVADVDHWVANRTSHQRLVSRYRDFDASVSEDLASNLPDHFAARVLNGVGSICSGQNIFLFFPECFNIEGRSPEDYFGIELIDVWENVFTKVVFPCARRVFTSATQAAVMSHLSLSLDKTIYLAALYHEIGHQVGAWKVSPQMDPRIQVEPFFIDTFGELMTDCLLVKNLKEFPEIQNFVLLQRLFWFGRRGFRDNPTSAWINRDNDSWISALLWNRLERAGAIRGEGDRLHLELEKVYDVFCQILADIEALGQTILTLPADRQTEILQAWMQNEVTWVRQGGFILPVGLQSIYLSCASIEEIPLFQPLLGYSGESYV